MFSLKLKLDRLIFVALAWSYLIHPTLWPFSENTFLRVLFISGGIFYLASLYRGIEFDMPVMQEDVSIFAAYVAFFALLNLPILRESLGCDELYHSERAVFYLHALKFIPEGCCGAAGLRWLPINALNSLMMFILVLAAGTGYGTLGWFRRRVPKRSIRWAVYLVLVVAVGLMIGSLKAPAEAHPPLRLLPLFLFQAFFGLQDISFRLPGIVAMAAVSFSVYRLVRHETKSPGWFYPFLIGFSLYMIPTVFHVSAIVQPSVWAFCAAVFSLCGMILAQRRKDETLLIFSSAVIGLGCLMRQNAVILWPAFFLYCYFNRRWIRRWPLVLAPILFIGPYAMTVTKIGHPMATVQTLERPSDRSDLGNQEEAETPVHNVLKSLETGIGPRTIWKSSSVPWVLFTLAGIGILVFVYRGSLSAGFLTLFAGYGLFFTISPKLWGVGRYQAEYVAPCMALTILLLALSVKGRWRAVLAAALIYLSAYSFYFNLTVPQDTHYDHWARKRLSTESTFPYKDALGFVQRQPGDGRFVILGGVPTYGRMIAWLRGFNYFETENFWSLQKELNASVGTLKLAEFLAFASKHDIAYFLVQYGDKRERQHRSPALQSLMVELGTRSSSVLGKPPGDYVLQKSYVGKMEGAIDVYGKSDRRYF